MGKQAGFTLIEISIVLVIVGLLLGGVLKGQELINNARIKRLNSDMNGVSSAIYSYLDRYNAVPGDDDNAGTRWTGAVAGGGDGIIDGSNPFSTTITDENVKLWDHLRRANLISGIEYELPVHAFGGSIGIANGMYGISGPTVCMNQVEDKFVEIIDIQTDDGKPQTGTLRSNPAAPTGTTPTDYANYSADGDPLYLCRQI